MPGIESIAKPTSGSSGSSGCGTTLIVGFFGISIVAGLAIGHFLSIRPLYRAWQASAWTATTCEVISSRVMTGDETARADIVFRYQVGGRDYTANRYHFLPGSNSDTTVYSVVERLEPGTAFECYVDPQDPSQAVINRTPTYWYYFGFIFMVVFAGIPAAVGLVMIRSSTRAATPPMAPTPARAGFAPDSPSAGAASGTAAGPVVLQPSTTPLGQVLLVTLLCLLWNGVVGVVTYFAYRSFVQGEPVGWMALLLLLLQLAGIGLIAAVLYELLALANPRPVVTLGRASVPIGAAMSFGWELSGRAHRVTRLCMTLRGTEEATYRRGTDTSTDTHVFFEQTLVDASHAMAIAHGSGTLRIPAETMHTFTAANNKVVWTLRVNGEIARWPDVDETFDITVRPE